MELKVKKFIYDNQLLKRDASIIVGLSGGADSIVLLSLLNKLGYRCIAAHCNFHLRGEESNRDESFTKEFAAMLNIPFHKIDFDTYSYASSHKLSIEMAARELRYSWFNTLLEETNAQGVAVGHHIDDSVETFLLNLIRGTGIHGLTGIKIRNGNIIRPLLCLTRNEIIEYAEQKGLGFVTDSTNQQDDFTRNKIRLKLIPLLETFNPSVKEAIFRTSQNLFFTSEIFDNEIKEWKEKVFDKERACIDIIKLKDFIVPQTLLYEILSEYDFTNHVVEDIMKSLDGQSGKEFFSAGYRLIKDRDYLLLSPLKVEELMLSFEISKNTVEILQPVAINICYKEKPNSISFENNKKIAYFDPDKLSYPLTLRKWRKGDRFVPFGMNGSQKLSDYFSNHKYSKLDKENAWLLCSGKDIIWIVGERSDNRFRVDEKSKSVCIMKVF